MKNVGPWSVSLDNVIVQGTCLDKSKVTGEVKYEHAIFSTELCQKVAHTLKNIRDLIHNEFVLHAYEAQLSRYTSILCLFY